MSRAGRSAVVDPTTARSVITRNTLDAYPPRPAGQLLSISPKCHPDSGMEFGYDRSTGRALLFCETCKAGVAWLQLATEVPS